MSGFDKLNLMRELINKGWRQAIPQNDCESFGGYCLVPPESLWKNKPSSFYVYDAENLQDLLEPKGEDDD